MRNKTPKLSDPAAIRNEIERLQNRIGELRALLPLAEVQHLRRSLYDRDPTKASTKAVPR